MQTVSTGQLVGQTVGHYAIKSLLGRGRLSAVYLAQHPSQNIATALTTFIVPDHYNADMRTRFMQRFTREAAALTALSHRDVLPVFEYGEQFGYPYLITPYMSHGSLADILKRQGRCTPAFALQVLEQVAAGLEHAHRKGVVHGTLKPANILSTPDGKLLIAGFGLVHMLQMRGIEQSDQPYAYLLSIANTFLYASTYIAPEVVQGQPVDVRSDIYALGVILFEMLSGKPPFSSTSPLDTAIQHVQSPLPSLHKLSSDIPIAMELVVNHALARDPAQRFQSVGELLEAFAQVCQGVAQRPQNTQNNESAFLLDKPSPVQNLQNVPEEEVSIGGWQLTPPIMTGKLLASRPSASNSNGQSGVIPGQPIPGSTDGWQILPPIVTGRVAAVRPSQEPPAPKPVAPTSFLQQPDYPFTSALAPAPAPIVQMPQPTQAPSPLPTGPNANDANDMITPTWWVQSPPPRVVPLASAQEASAIEMPNPNREKTKPTDPSTQTPDTVMRVRPTRRARNNVGRRRVLATIAAGSVVAAGALIAGKMNLAHLVPQLNTHTAQGTTTGTGQQTQAGNTPTATPKSGMNPGTTGATHTGKVLGTTSIAPNTALYIVNPADNKPSLLIHLPNGNFVAYERACTHEGVEVNYDPKTHTLVCPAHGAIFDPRNKASVLQGPAQTPLAPVAIRVNADGTITAA